VLSLIAVMTHRGTRYGRRIDHLLAIRCHPAAGAEPACSQRGANTVLHLEMNAK
jgi:hypothetical protein